MAEFANLVHETSTSTGTGNFTLAPVNGRQIFSDAFGTGGSDVFYYAISNRDADEWEVGTGHMSDATTLVRDTVIQNSNGDTNPVDFSAGTKDVMNDIPAPRQQGVDVQVFTGNGTWTKPVGAAYVFIKMWAGGASGGRGGSGDGGGGGGGGAYREFFLPASDFDATEAVTVGAGGPAQTSDNQAGTAGGNTSVNSITYGDLIVYGGGAGGGAGSQEGGGGGGGQGSAGSTGSTTNVSGGTGLGGIRPHITTRRNGAFTDVAQIVGEGTGGSNGVADGITAGGAGPATSSSIQGGNSVYGGGGGGCGTNTNTNSAGGESKFGGGGGGGGSDSGSGSAGGTSVFGGNGGAGATGATNATAGSIPGGGGGGSETGNSGAGARGEVQIITWIAAGTL